MKFSVKGFFSKCDQICRKYTVNFVQCFISISEAFVVIFINKYFLESIRINPPHRFLWTIYGYIETEYFIRRNLLAVARFFGFRSNVSSCNFIAASNGRASRPTWNLCCMDRKSYSNIQIVSYH